MPSYAFRKVFYIRKNNIRKTATTARTGIRILNLRIDMLVSGIAILSFLFQ
jgi:hypothetical protein